MGVTVMVALMVSVCLAGEVGFPEDFALAKDRKEPLKQLIPGTKDYYYYHCLHHQNAGQPSKVDEKLKPWIERYKRTPRVREIENRRALLRYPKDPKGSLEFIRQRLGLRFEHHRELVDQERKLPTRLDPKLISRETLTQRALKRPPDTLQGFEDTALDWLIAMDLGPDRRRHLLHRLKRPDHANLPKLVVDDLNYRHSRGFGCHGIHRLLLLSQLEACLKLKPDLLNQTRFVEAYLTKLRPNPDTDWRHDPKVRQAYLERLWAFAARLNPSHNSLKAHVLYHRLVHDRALGVYDTDRFLTYIQLPRNVGYINRRYLERHEHRRYPANLQANYQRFTLLPPIGNDEPLVRSYLAHFFVKADSYKPYDTYINDIYLRRLFAETKIVHGLGDMERWHAMLPPAMYQALRDRVDIDFAYTNRTLFGVGDPVALDVFVKNVKTLIVKVFEINTLNYYRANRREVDTAVNLDGLVANQETVHTYKEPSLRRVKRTFEFPALKRRGTYVVELIGNGRSSRALIRKGKLRFLVRASTAGHVFTILDEANRKVADAALWLAGHHYPADEDGTITVPFSSRPGRQPVILTHGDFASLDFFQHEAERYTLSAGIHIDREALLTRKQAAVIIRPALHLNGTPVTLSVLKDPTLVIASADRDGVQTTKEVKGFKLFEDRESVYQFQVPKNLARLRFILKARVENLSQKKTLDLQVSKDFALNAIDRTEKIEDLHLSHIDGQYVLDVLGRTGEPKASRPVNMELSHRDFRETVHVSLQSDARGRIGLGALNDIRWLKAKGPEGTEHRWHLLKDQHSYPRTVHGRANETIFLPYMGTEQKPLRSKLSLLERRDGTFLQDRFDALAIRNGFVELRDLPAGDYDLLVKDGGTQVTVRLTEGAESEGYVLSANRHLQVRNPKPLQIAAVGADKDAVTIRLENASKFARVHLAATRYTPEFPMYPDLHRVPFPEPYLISVPKVESLYVVGRDIGDEYRYILERKYAKKYPGNTLKRPSLLLNPWAIRKTETERQVARPGGRFARRAAKGRGARARPAAKREPPIRPSAGFANLDFLSAQAVVLTNLRPDKKGVVTVKREDLGAHHQLHIVAVDPRNTAYREVSLPETQRKFSDLRLADGLDPKKHFTEQKQISIVQAKGKFVLSDILTSSFETYDSLDKVFALYATLSGNPTLVEFGFVLNWPNLKPEEKRKQYTKYACHELNFFLFRKDPEFFKTVVLPYIRNKKDKTFLDHWLLGDDLSDYLKPWAFAQLNIVERILLAQRIRAERPHTARHVRDLFDLIPPNIERFNHLFNTALKGRALETGDVFGLGEARDKLEAKKRAELRRAGRPSVVALRSEAARTTPGEAAPTAPAAPPPAAKAARGRRLAQAAAEERPAEEGEADQAGAFYAMDARRRKAVRQLFRQLDRTKEWVENNYYHLPIERQNAKLITVNAFWRDYAQRDGKAAFFSTHLAEASRNFPEMMFALALLDIPFKAAEHKHEVTNPRFTLRAGSPMVIYHKEIKEAKAAEEKIPILISQNFFRHGDRYRHVNNERIDKYVTDEFLIHVVYGCHVVITNPTSSRQKLDVLLQIPGGAIPVNNGHYTRSRHIDLQPYRTQTFEYYFYFPAPGDYAHYPVHVAKNEELIAFAPPVSLNVVEKPSKIDRASWDYISQHGTEDQVLAYLKDNNLNRTNLDRIAWRMRDLAFFRRVLAILDQRHVYNHTLWSYSIRHNELPAIREYLQHCNAFVSQCGSYIDTQLLTIDPVVRKSYQHMEYWPLVNARAHRLGKSRKILNNRFYQQYMRLMKVLTYRPKLDDDDLLSTTYYMLLQDRTEEALAFFQRVDPKRLATRLQYDYLAAYLDFYNDKPQRARSIAARYADYSVDRWRNLFASVTAQLDEIEGKAPKVVDEEDRTQRQTQLAATEASFDFEVEARKITLTYQNIAECRVNYSLMDIELLFSRNPFVQQYSGQFAYIRPNETATIKLDPKQATHTFDLPKRFHSSNVMIEILAGGVKKSKAYFSNALALQVVENYGQLRVAHARTAKPLPKVYVKVYARMRDGRVRFYRDGYTDLRGRFDYASLSTNDLDFVQNFSLLVLSQTDGAVVREAAPPKR